MSLSGRSGTRLVAVILGLVFVGSVLSFSAGAPVTNQATVTPPQTTFSFSPPTDSVWWVGAQSSDSSALPNTGVRSSIQVISDSSIAENDCLSFWIADGLTNNEWGQVGYYLCDGDAPTAFYQIWDLSSDTILSGGTESVSAGTHVFSMYLQSGTTWAYALDGTVFGTYDMGASSRVQPTPSRRTQKSRRSVCSPSRQLHFPARYRC